MVDTSNGVHPDNETLKNEGLEEYCKAKIDFVDEHNKNDDIKIEGLKSTMGCPWCPQVDEKENLTVKASPGEEVHLMCKANGTFVPRTCLFESPSHQLSAQFVTNSTCLKVRRI